MSSHVFIKGNLVRDPESKVSNSGVGFVYFDIAVNVPTKNGESKAEFYSCKTFNEYCMNLVSQHIKKGDTVCINNARLSQYSYEDSDNKKRIKIEIIFNEINLVQRVKNKIPDDSPKSFKEVGERLYSSPPTNEQSDTLTESESIPF